jgi:hypothetical protein
MNDAASALAGHNGPPPSEARKLFAAAKASLGAHSRHSKNAVEQLRAFLVRVMETYEYALQSPENAAEVELELFRAHAPRGQSGDWFRPLVKAAFDEADREREKTNISKYVSVLSYAKRQGTRSAQLAEFLATRAISEIVALEAKARRAGNGKPTTEKPDPAFEAVIKKRRKPVNLPGIVLNTDKRFEVLVVEHTPDQGPCLVAQETPDIKYIRLRYFAAELPKRGRPRAATNEQEQPQT